MIIKDSERSTKVRVAMREGPGQVIIKDICSKYRKGTDSDCKLFCNRRKGSVYLRCIL